MGAAHGNRFLGLAWDADQDASALAPLRSAAATTARWPRADAPGLSLVCERSDFQYSTDDFALCMASRRVIEPAQRRAHDPRSLHALVRIDGVDAVAMLAAPFCVAWLDGRRGVLEASADRFGIGQLFYVRSNGIAGVSNSAALLAGAFARALDWDALTGFALFGAFQESDTPYAGVQKVPAGRSVQMSAGRCVIRDLRRSPVAGAAPARSVAALAAQTRQIVVELSEAAPEADLQLSGGLDSRLILAALPPDRRRRHRAVTIGAAASPDVRIARELAERFDLQHAIFDPRAIDDLGADSLHAALKAAVRGFDYAANPIDKAALMLTDGPSTGAACFNGQNGELLRGFYFPGQPLKAKPSEALARGLIGLRLESNDLVNPILFQRAGYEDRRARAEVRTVQRLVSLGGAWSEALDRFYLYERMQRWAGNGLNSVSNERTYLCPFFDARFVDACLGLEPQLKSNSRAAYRLLAELDPDLANIPLDSGVCATAMVRSPMRARLCEAEHFLKKAGAHMGRRVFRGRRSTFGSASVGRLWHRHRLFERLPGERLAAAGVFEPAALKSVLSGQWLPDRATLGFMLLVSELLENS